MTKTSNSFKHKQEERKLALEVKTTDDIVYTLPRYPEQYITVKNLLSYLKYIEKRLWDGKPVINKLNDTICELERAKEGEE